MHPSSDPIAKALDTLYDIQGDALESYRAKVTKLLQNLQDFIEGSHQPTSISTLITALRINSAEIKDFINAEHDTKWRTRISDMVPLGEDPRVFDLEVNRKSLDARFRKGLSQIPSASAYSDWEIRNADRGETTVEALVNDLSASGKRKCLYVKEYLDCHARHFKNKRVALDGIKHGIKCLVFEKLFGYSSVLAILSFVYHQFRTINFEKLRI
ncbi:MAG: hypothetical protein L6R40_008280 [Gallowayella cf. fulva]|nr:MAG: hypothetical protein L6R40_008280 [Xanthomendoza cf. fulva]